MPWAWDAPATSPTSPTAPRAAVSSSFEVGRLIDEVHGRMVQLGAKFQVSLTPVVTSDQLPRTFDADPSKAALVLAGAVENAIFLASPGGRVGWEVTNDVKRSPGFVKIRVEVHVLALAAPTEERKPVLDKEGNVDPRYRRMVLDGCQPPPLTAMQHLVKALKGTFTREAHPETKLPTFVLTMQCVDRLAHVWATTFEDKASAQLDRLSPRSGQRERQRREQRGKGVVMLAEPNALARTTICGQLQAAGYAVVLAWSEQDILHRMGGNTPHIDALVIAHQGPSIVDRQKRFAPPLPMLVLAADGRSGALSAARSPRTPTGGAAVALPVGTPTGPPGPPTPNGSGGRGLSGERGMRDATALPAAAGRGTGSSALSTPRVGGVHSGIPMSLATALMRVRECPVDEIKSLEEARAQRLNQSLSTFVVCDGVSVMQRLRARGVTRPIIGLTGQTGADELHVDLAEGHSPHHCVPISTMTALYSAGQVGHVGAFVGARTYGRTKTAAGFTAVMSKPPSIPRLVALLDKVTGVLPPKLEPLGVLHAECGPTMLLPANV